MGHVDFALSVFGKVLKCRLVVSFKSLTNRMCRNGMVDYARKVFDKIPEKNVVTDGILVNGLCKMGDVNDAVMLLMNIGSPSVIMYNVIINSICKNGRVDHALGLYHEMIEKGVVPNNMTYMCLMKGLCGFGLRVEA
nr:pentatricopeptide repeat-containing protein At1g63330-like [Tanacetum cinerariifolium]